MPATEKWKASILICTRNRAWLLRQTLQSLLSLEPISGGAEIVVIDDGSSDDTPAVVAAAAAGALPIRYVRQPPQGKSSALNTGLSRITSEIVAFTDDDVVVPASWLNTAVAALDELPDVGYVGGPVRPIWQASPPAWFPPTNHNLWGTVAALDYGPDRFVFEETRRVPLGVNMAVRREVFDRAGLFNPEFGRTGASLLGQEQAEFFCRTRRAGVVGAYVPEMELHHHVPAGRLTRRYFRRWWFWKGISRARLQALHPVTETGLDMRTVARLAGVPRFVFSETIRHSRGLVHAIVAGDRVSIAEHELMVGYNIGYAFESCRSAWRRVGMTARDRYRSRNTPASWPIHDQDFVFHAANRLPQPPVEERTTRRRS